VWWLLALLLLPFRGMQVQKAKSRNWTVGGSFALRQLSGQLNFN
jgi:hypothetical protein